MSQDYKDSLFLPSTEFPMRAGLPNKEPAILQRWQDKKIYRTLRHNRRGKRCYILHDGPPYANGHLHIGHALNKILKDVVVRTQAMMGHDIQYVPGWDCHGLPIEWKIEENFNKKGRHKEQISPAEFRNACRDFATHWMDIQSQEFQRLGILGDWKHSYNTMTPLAEASIARQLLNMASQGRIYRHSKPVLWSCVEKTALAEAEVEYRMHESDQIWLLFTLDFTDKQERQAVLPASLTDEEEIHLLIWTTTPWTIPANMAMAFNPDIDYGLYRVTLPDGKKMLIALADKRSEDVCTELSLSSERLGNFHPQNSKLQGLHPLRHYGGFFDQAQEKRPLCAADFVTDDQGTGFVHIAPGHGDDDYQLWRQQENNKNRDIPYIVMADGSYNTDLIPAFWHDTDNFQTEKNVYILDRRGRKGGSNKAVIACLQKQGMLLGHKPLQHSYPHSWRSGAPLIYRNTAQWFIHMEAIPGEKQGLRDKALTAIEKTQFFPEKGRKRLQGMVQSRPDWVISRQRHWGVPIPLIVERQTGKIINNESINNRIDTIFRQEGSDSWFTRPVTDFFPEYDAQQHEQVCDILDVWFDSGCSAEFVLYERLGVDVNEQADLYLEGSDQHRGWFQSSLLVGAGLRGHAPYKNILTHGFVLDEKGEKMSKTRGNVIAPQEVIRDYGADILRLWVVMSDYSEDLRIGKQILKNTADTYRRFRNVLRWLLGVLPTDQKPDTKSYLEIIGNGNSLPLPERWVLHRLYEVDQQIQEHYKRYEFSQGFMTLFRFCTNDLSAFYFDLRKDSVYCDAFTSERRQSCLQVLTILFEVIIRWSAPVLCFTTDEAWRQRYENADCLHLQESLDLPNDWLLPDTELSLIQNLLTARSQILSALEEQRRDGKLGSSLEASIQLYTTAQNLSGQDALLADLCIVSQCQINIATEESIIITQADGEKCARCWKVLPEVAENSQKLCQRCAQVVNT